MYVSGNELSGPLPPQWAALPNLRFLFLNGNDLSGSLPPEWGGMGSFEQLVLDGNGLSGAIPSEWGGMAALEDLFLRDNSLSGSIPGALDNLGSLEDLYLEGNAFTGCIPAGLRDTERSTIWRRWGCRTAPRAARASAYVVRLCAIEWTPVMRSRYVILIVLVTLLGALACAPVGGDISVPTPTFAPAPTPPLQLLLPRLTAIPTAAPLHLPPMPTAIPAPHCNRCAHFHAVPLFLHLSLTSP